MRGYLLDTCALSEFTKPKPARGVARWFQETAEESQFVSVLSVGELEKGVRLLAAGRRREQLHVWLEAVRVRFASRILDVTEQVAVEWARIATEADVRGDRLPVVDALIGATAIVHDLTVVTRNTTDVARSGARTLDPWQED